MTFLVDTNVISEARKPAGNANVRAWMSSVADRDLYISVLAVGEIRQGIERLRSRDPAQAAVLDEWLNHLYHDYMDRIIPITAEIAEEWGRMNVPDSLPAIDGLMAATARVENLTLVTRNTADVARTGVRLLNPFETVS